MSQKFPPLTPFFVQGRPHPPTYCPPKLREITREQAVHINNIKRPALHFPQNTIQLNLHSLVLDQKTQTHFRLHSLEISRTKNIASITVFKAMPHWCQVTSDNLGNYGNVRTNYIHSNCISPSGQIQHCTH